MYVSIGRELGHKANWKRHALYVTVIRLVTEVKGLLTFLKFCYGTVQLQTFMAKNFRKVVNIL